MVTKLELMLEIENCVLHNKFNFKFIKVSLSPKLSLRAEILVRI